MNDEYIYCDDCGERIKSSSAHHHSILPCDVSSANAGESASVCAKCDRRIVSDSERVGAIRKELEQIRSERDEAIIHANNVVRESSRLITARIPSGSCGGYWNAVDNFRRFESKTT